MGFNPSTQLTNTERIARFRKMVHANTPLEAIRHELDASVDDLRTFVKLNVPDLADVFEAVVQKAQSSHDTHASKNWHRRGLEARARSRGNTENVRRVTKAEILEGLILGEFRFSEEERPFNQLPEETQADVRYLAETFTDWRDRHP